MGFLKFGLKGAMTEFSTLPVAGVDGVTVRGA